MTGLGRHIHLLKPVALTRPRLDDALPPSYDTGSSQQPDTDGGDYKEQLPAYDDPVSSSSSPPSSSSWEALVPEPTPTLVLEGRQIYSTTYQSRPLYQLNAAPSEAGFRLYSLEKLYYKTRGPDQQQVKIGRTVHCYDFKTQEWIRKEGFRDKVDIMGKRSRETTVKEAILERSGPGHFSVSCWKIAEQKLSVAPASGVLSTESDVLNWELDGKVIAVETKGTRDADAKMVVMPRLEIIKEGLSEKEMDLLVVAWCVRTFKESEKAQPHVDGTKRSYCEFLTDRPVSLQYTTTRTNGRQSSVLWRRQ
jgi:hypothetical protein